MASAISPTVPARMIYLDVTDTCQSPMNTGVQRVARGIFCGLKEARAPVVPVLWEPALKSFCTLASRELKFLEKPFAGAYGRKALARPQHATRAVPVWSAFWRRAAHRRNRVDLAARLTAADVLFAPEIFKDGRRDWLDVPGSLGPARSVAVFHDAIPWRRPELVSHAGRKGFSEYLLALSRLDGVIAVSQASADDLRACWKSQGVSERQMPPITIMGWPVDDLFAAVKPAASPRVADNSAVAPKILCVGTLEARKNHLALLAAAERLWRGGLDFELILAGRTTAPFGGRVLAEVKRLRKAGRRLAWRRHVDDGSLLAAYDECAFTVFPSLMEGFGLPIMESLLRGRPCVCGANGALGEIAGDGCLTVDQTDPEQLAGAMKQLLTDAKLRARLCAAARGRRFRNWGDYTDEILPLLAPAAS